MQMFCAAFLTLTLTLILTLLTGIDVDVLRSIHNPNPTLTLNLPLTLALTLTLLTGIDADALRGSDHADSARHGLQLGYGFKVRVAG